MDEGSPSPSSSLNEGEGGHEGKETTTTLTRREKRAVETGWSNFSQHFSSSSAGGANSVNNISGNAIAILITERPWGVSVVMLPSSVPCLRNFHPRTKTTFFCEACFHRCADFPLCLSLLFPSFLLPSLSPLHASSTSSRPILVALSRPRQFPFTRSAFQFIPFAGFTSLCLSLSLSLPHFRDIKPWFSRFDPTACHNTMARRVFSRRQARSSSLSCHRLLTLIEHRIADCWLLTERGNILKEDEIFVVGKDRVVWYYWIVIF